MQWVEAERDVRPVKWKDLPKERQAEAKRLAGVPSRGYRAARSERVSNSIPASWTDHSKSCGWAGTGECLYCGSDGEQTMWKRLDPKISTSEKHAKFGFSPLTLWVMMLPHTDAKGRYWANASYIKGQCLPLFDHVRLEQIEQALLELQEVRLLHLYDSNGKRYLVYHDVEDFNPPGALRYQKPQWPDPSEDLCKCLSRRESGVLPPLVSSPSSSSSSSEGVQGEGPLLPGSPEAMIVGILERKNCPSAPKTIRRYARGWISDKGFQFVEQATMDPWCKGKDVIAIHDRFFREAKGPVKTPKRKAANPGCEKCGGKGRRLNPVTNAEMDCVCVREVAV